MRTPGLRSPFAPLIALALIAPACTGDDTGTASASSTGTDSDGTSSTSSASTSGGTTSGTTSAGSMTETGGATTSAGTERSTSLPIASRSSVSRAALVGPPTVSSGTS